MGPRIFIWGCVRRSVGPSVCLSVGNLFFFKRRKWAFFFLENHRDSLTSTLLNVLSVLGVLNMLNVLVVLNVLNMPMDASLASWALLVGKDASFIKKKKIHVREVRKVGMSFYLTIFRCIFEFLQELVSVCPSLRFFFCIKISQITKIWYTKQK